ncbi:MAG: hypothetical protein MJA83_11735 [Gammaproteobacteria bacterium]|nr:hypothetical protein [Gammaproteobacteria bacterium]
MDKKNLKTVIPINRRNALMTGIGVAAGGSLLVTPAEANIPVAGYSTRATRVTDVTNNRNTYRSTNARLRSSRFKIRIQNNFTWDIKFGLFGISHPQEWRRRINGGGNTYQSRRAEISGGERAAVIWDDFSEAMLDLQWVLVNRDITIEVDTAGVMTIT